MDKLKLRDIKPPDWNRHWSRTPYPAVSSVFEKAKRGKAVISQMYMAHFAIAMGPAFADGVRLLDYGCGSGRFANFLARRINTFQYYGVEPDEFCTHFKQFWRHAKCDPRIRFGAIGSLLEQDSIAAADVVVLASVLTHLHHTQLAELTLKFWPILARGGLMVFSCFMANKSSLGREKFPGYYREVFYSHSMIRKGLSEFPVDWQQVGTWLGSRIPQAIVRVKAVKP